MLLRDAGGDKRRSKGPTNLRSDESCSYLVPGTVAPENCHSELARQRSDIFVSTLWQDQDSSFVGMTKSLENSALDTLPTQRHDR